MIIRVVLFFILYIVSMNILAWISNINYVSVLIASIAACVLGLIWYSSWMFGRYVHAVRDMSEGAARNINFPALINRFVMLFIGAMIVALFVWWAGLTQWLQIWFLIWVLIMTSMLSGAAFESRSMSYRLVHAGYILIAWTLVGGVIWHI